MSSKIEDVLNCWFEESKKCYDCDRSVGEVCANEIHKQIVYPLQKDISILLKTIDLMSEEILALENKYKNNKYCRINHIKDYFIEEAKKITRQTE